MANHPNQWYLASVKYHKIKSGVSVKAEEKGGAAMTEAVADSTGGPESVPEPGEDS